MIWSRRRLLKAGGAFAGISAAALWGRSARGQDLAARRDPANRRIALLNLHTDERVEVDYFRDGAYVPEALSAIEVCCGIFAPASRHAIDPHLMDYLVEVARAVGAEPKFSVISGYRSPQTNAMLHERSAGVAQHSLHMEGRAIDVRISGRRLRGSRRPRPGLEARRGRVLPRVGFRALGYRRVSDLEGLSAADDAAPS